MYKQGEGEISPKKTNLYKIREGVSIHANEMKLAYVDSSLERPAITVMDSGDAQKYLKEIWTDICLRESFYVLLLAQSNRVKGHVLVSFGGVGATVVEPMQVVGAAILSNTKRIIVAHNHPSGLTTPSDSDKSLTSRIRAAASYYQIELLDHLIITGNDGYYSFGDNGII